jgi:hypothetical protein
VAGDGYCYDPRGAVHEVAIAYDEPVARGMLEQAGFRDIAVDYGHWAGRTADHAQDFMVGRRR